MRATACWSRCSCSRTRHCRTPPRPRLVCCPPAATVAARRSTHRCVAACPPPPTMAATHAAAVAALQRGAASPCRAHRAVKATMRCELVTPPPQAATAAVPAWRMCSALAPVAGPGDHPEAQRPRPLRRRRRLRSVVVVVVAPPSLPVVARMWASHHVGGCRACRRPPATGCSLASVVRRSSLACRVPCHRLAPSSAPPPATRRRQH